MAAPIAHRASTDRQLTLESAPRFSFSGHQTFSFRYSWLPKGVLAVKEDPEIFFREDALVKLGVGKNMVDSIRFWCEALGLITVSAKERRADLLPLGERLFGKGKSKGWDPYLEDPATLWLLPRQVAAQVGGGAPAAGASEPALIRKQTADHRAQIEPWAVVVRQ